MCVLVPQSPAKVMIFVYEISTNLYILMERRALSLERAVAQSMVRHGRALPRRTP